MRQPVSSRSGRVTPAVPRFKKINVKFMGEVPAPAKKKYGCLMLQIPAPLAKKIKEWGRSIPKEHLAPEGLEENSHVTVKYGFVDDSGETVESLTEFMKEFGPVKIRIGPLSLFRGNEDGDVLKFNIISPQLVRINQLVSARYECEDKYPVYNPHLTVAYLKPEFSGGYDGMLNEFTGEEVLVTEAVFGDKQKKTTKIPLEKKPRSHQDLSMMKSLRVKYRKIMEGNQAWDLLRRVVAPEVAEMVMSGDYEGVMDRIMDAFYQIDATDESPAGFSLDRYLSQPRGGRVDPDDPSNEQLSNIPRYDDVGENWKTWAKEITDRLFRVRENVIERYGDSAVDRFSGYATRLLGQVAQSIQPHWLTEEMETLQERRRPRSDREIQFENRSGGEVHEPLNADYIRDRNYQERRRAGNVRETMGEEAHEAEQLRREMRRNEQRIAAEEREEENSRIDRRVDARRRKEEEGYRRAMSTMPYTVTEGESDAQAINRMSREKDLSSLDETSGGALREPAKQEYPDSLTDKQDDPGPGPRSHRVETRKPRQAFELKPHRLKKINVKFRGHTKMAMSPKDAYTAYHAIIPDLVDMALVNDREGIIDRISDLLVSVEESNPTVGEVDYGAGAHIPAQNYGFTEVAKKIADKVLEYLGRHRGLSDVRTDREVATVAFQYYDTDITYPLERHEQRSYTAQSYARNGERVVPPEYQNYLPRPPKEPKKSLQMNEEPPTEQKRFRKTNVKFRSK